MNNDELGGEILDGEPPKDLIDIIERTARSPTVENAVGSEAAIKRLLTEKGVSLKSSVNFTYGLTYCKGDENWGITYLSSTNSGNTEQNIIFDRRSDGLSLVIIRRTTELRLTTGYGTNLTIHSFKY